MDLLLKHVSWSSDHIGAAIVGASSSGSTECLKLLLAVDTADPMYMQGAALKAAAENGFDFSLYELVRHARAEPEIDEQFVLRWASMRGLTRSVAVLLKGLKTFSLLFAESLS